MTSKPALTLTPFKEPAMVNTPQISKQSYMNSYPHLFIILTY